MVLLGWDIAKMLPVLSLLQEEHDNDVEIVPIHCGQSRQQVNPKVSSVGVDDSTHQSCATTTSCK